MVNIDPKREKKSKPVYYGEETGEPIRVSWWLGCVTIITFIGLILGAIVLIIMYGG